MAKTKIKLERHVVVGDRVYDAGEQFVTEAEAKAIQADARRASDVSYPDAKPAHIGTKTRSTADDKPSS